MDKVTVVIPSYNHGNYIGEAIDSVLSQTHKNIELIVIDDGSSDNTKNVIETKLKQTDQEFIFLQKENAGLIDSLSRGLKMANGDYFCQLASDDYLPENSIQERLNYLKERPTYSAVFTDGLTVLNTTVTTDKFLTKKHKDLFKSKDQISVMLNGTLPVFATGLFPTQKLKDAGGFDDGLFRYYEDLDTPIRLALLGPLGYIDQTLFFRREHDSNVSRYTKHIRREKILAYVKLAKQTGMQPYSKLLKQRITRSYISLGKHIKEQGQATEEEYQTFNQAWPFAWNNPKLLLLLLLNKNKNHV